MHFRRRGDTTITATAIDEDGNIVRISVEVTSSISRGNIDHALHAANQEINAKLALLFGWQQS